MTGRRIGDASLVVSARLAGGDGFVAPDFDPPFAPDVDPLFAPPLAAAPEPVGLVGLRDPAEAPVAPDFARRAALDRAAEELPPGPRR